MDASGAFSMSKKALPVVMLDEIEGMPVIHACPAKPLVGDLKTIGANEMKPAINAGAETTDAPGVLRYLRMKQYEVDQRRWWFLRACSASR